MTLTYAKFKEDVQRILEAYLRFLAKAIESKQLEPAPEDMFLFPTTLVFARTSTHYAFELFGGSPTPVRLQIKENKTVRQFNQLVNGFSATSSTAYVFGTEDSQPTNLHLRFERLTFTCTEHTNELSQRFPTFKALAPTSALASNLSHDSMLAINADPIRTLALNQCLFTSNVDKVVRPKYVNFLFGESVQASRSELLQDLTQHFALQPNTPLKGVRVVSSGDQQAHLAAGFTSLYLQGVSEPTITGFLEIHEEVITRAFGAEKIFYQPKLEWREGNSDPTELFIQPDMVIRRADGTWIIVEFKLPLLEKRRLTKGGHKRRRFIDAVYEGIGQLFNYEEYFRLPANQEAARERLGELPLNPELVLVVGNAENADTVEIREAQRSNIPFVLIDYDSLVRLYMEPLPPLATSFGSATGA